MVLDSLFTPPTGHEHYLQLSRDLQCNLSLTREKAAVIHKAYDYGIGALDKTELKLLNPVISTLKVQIHP